MTAISYRVEVESKNAVETGEYRIIARSIEEAIENLHDYFKRERYNGTYHIIKVEREGFVVLGEK